MGGMTDADRTPARAGRPRRSSAEVLADAAAELFLEQGYAGTTVDDVARRAGVSRGTFFNYFGSKADTFWVDVDRTLEVLPEVLRASGRPAGDPLRSVADVLVALAVRHDPAGVPWALTQAEAMQLGEDVVTSAAPRLVDLVGRLAAHASDGVEPDAAATRVAVTALVAAAVAAFVEWARAGVGRGALEGYVAQAVDRIVGAG